MNLYDLFCQAWWMWSWMNTGIREYPFATLIIATLVLMLWRFLIPNPRAS